MTNGLVGNGPMTSGWLGPYLSGPEHDEDLGEEVKAKELFLVKDIDFVPEIRN